MGISYSVSCFPFRHSHLGVLVSPNVRMGSFVRGLLRKACKQCSTVRMLDTHENKQQNMTKTAFITAKQRERRRNFSTSAFLNQRSCVFYTKTNKCIDFMKKKSTNKKRRPQHFNKTIQTNQSDKHTLSTEVLLRQRQQLIKTTNVFAQHAIKCHPLSSSKWKYH